MLSDSDFSTGAFAAEYGNAISGVFDIHLRKGNNQKREYTIQAGVLGLDGAIEGPFKKGSDASYLVNYRYSTLGIISNLVDIGNAVTTFQDLSYNLVFPSKKTGTLSLFGINGISKQHQKDSLGNNTFDFTSNTFANGITYFKNLHPKIYFKSALVYSNTNQTFNAFEPDTLSNYFYDTYEESHKQQKITFSNKFSHKINANNSLKYGVIGTQHFFNLALSYKEDTSSITKKIVNSKGHTYSTQFFAQLQHKYNDKITANLGLHYFYLFLNKSQSLEPRIALQYEIVPGHTFSFGYGLHSQMQGLGTYFIQPYGNQSIYPNKNLALSKAHHYVFSYAVQLNPLLRMKIETYYQSLYDIPQGQVVEENLSVLNSQGGITNAVLNSKGKGKNYGLEFTAERYLNEGFYFMTTASIYEAKYYGTDGHLYNTRYNGNFALTLTSGKEMLVSEKKNRTLGINIKTIYNGGLRESPLDETRTTGENNIVRDQQKAFSVKMPAYFRFDLKLSLKRNYKTKTATLSLDIQNVSNRKNVGGLEYDKTSKKDKYWYQIGLLPVLSYKLEF